jgi:3-deoxy-D-manno-octulosonate 8-phosphate phosphatase (KDO 8-P phosphatase)
LRKMHIRDGYALQLAVRKGYNLVVISGSSSDAVRSRLQKLGVEEVHMNVTDKKHLLDQFMKSNGLKPHQVLYMGDDIPDLEAMQVAGMPCCPFDAAPEVKAVAHYVSPVNGGYGCVRDVIEKVMKLNGDWQHDEKVTSR